MLECFVVCFVFYKLNFTRKRKLVSKLKSESHCEKEMFSIWWNIKGILYFEVLSVMKESIQKDVINSLHWLSEKLYGNLKSQKKIWALKTEVLA